MRRIIVTATAPDPDAIGQAAAVLRGGGVAAIPTDTLYGLAADPFNSSAVARLFTIKARAQEKAIPLVAASLAQVRESIGELPAAAEQLAALFWPGPLTLLLDAPVGLAPEVSGGTGAVGVRVPAHDVARALCLAAGTPLTATSANYSGQPSTADPEQVLTTIGQYLDVLVDAGLTPGGAPSTIVDVTGPELRLVRAGAIPWDDVKAAAQR